MGKYTKRFLALALLSGVLLGLCACQKKAEPLRVGMMSDINSIPFILAKQQGFFPEDVSIEIFSSPTDRDSALFSGNLDGCSSDVLAVCLARNGGLPMYITSVTDGDYGLVAGANSGYTQASDLTGLEIGLSFNTIIEYVTDSILAKKGVAEADVVKTSVPKTPSRLELLEAGKLGAIAVPEPFVTTAKGLGGIVVGTASELDILPCVMMFGESAITGKTKQLDAFYAGYAKALAYMAEHPDFLAPVIEELGLPASAADMTLPAYRAEMLPERHHVEDAVTWLMDKELIAAAYSYEELVWDRSRD